MMEESFSEPLSGRSGQENAVMASFYIYHNTGIGLKCFASGLLVIPGLIITLFNAVTLGAAFGYMAQDGCATGRELFRVRDGARPLSN